MIFLELLPILHLNIGVIIGLAFDVCASILNDASCNQIKITLLVVVDCSIKDILTSIYDTVGIDWRGA